MPCLTYFLRKRDSVDSLFYTSINYIILPICIKSWILNRKCQILISVLYSSHMSENMWILLHIRNTVISNKQILRNMVLTEVVVTGFVLLESTHCKCVVRNLLKILHMWFHYQQVWSLGDLSVSLATKETVN